MSIHSQEVKAREVACQEYSRLSGCRDNDTQRRMNSDRIINAYLDNRAREGDGDAFVLYYQCENTMDIIYIGTSYGNALKSLLEYGKEKYFDSNSLKLAHGMDVAISPRSSQESPAQIPPQSK
jgi:hypothetical protein